MPVAGGEGGRDKARAEGPASFREEEEAPWAGGSEGKARGFVPPLGKGGCARAGALEKGCLMGYNPAPVLS